MPLSGKSVALLLVAVFAVAPVAYAAKPKPVEVINVPRTPMTASEAKAALLDSIKHSVYGPSMPVTISQTRITMTWQNNEVRFRFSEMKNLSIGPPTGYPTLFKFSALLKNGVGKDGAFKGLIWEPKDKRYATQFIDAALILKDAVLAAEQTDFAAFSAGAQAWLMATSRSEMPDDVRTFKLVAEDAFKRKDFTAALDAYGKALDMFPMWPEGQYNAALLAAETEDYELAAQHMRRYLVLAPDAKDASAAKDKLLLWQHKAKE